MNNSVDFNNITVTGRVYFTERVTNNGDTWLKVVVISNTQKDATGTTFTFNTTQMDGLVDKGYLPVGRFVTITGRIKSVATTYFDKKAGSTKELKHPNIHLEGVSIPKGGLGAMPTSNTSNAQTVWLLMLLLYQEASSHLVLSWSLLTEAPCFLFLDRPSYLPSL